MKNKILKKDSKFIWHPFTQEKNSNTPIIVKKAKNEKIIDIDGNEYIDLISSWWVNTHGHCRDEIIKEISDQAKSIEQVLFAGFTHEPAVNLAEQLVGLLPDKLSKVFFSDNGSTSVEIAMKVAIQYWYNKGKKKNKFMAFDGGYHGDTLGAMSVGFSSGFYEPFSEIINKNFFFSFPENWFGNNQVELSEEESIRQVKNIISKEKDNIAAVIIEPLIQGAGGMRVCRKEYLNKYIGSCHLWNQVQAFYEKSKSSSLILPWSTVPPLTSLQKDILLRKEELYIGSDGVSFCKKLGALREYYYFAPEVKQKRFLEYASNNIDVIKPEITLFRNDSINVIQNHLNQQAN